MDVVQSAVSGSRTERSSITLATVPSDGDREGVQLARALAENLEAVGLAVDIDYLSPVEFYRTVLLEGAFDCYVGRYPAFTDPDVLYEALHSRYADESGWQNPFGFSNTAVDDLLEEQRTTGGERRREVVVALLERLTEEQPFVPICVPDEVRAVRTDRFDGWEGSHLATRLGYLGLTSGGDDAELTTVVTDSRPTRNLNPVAAHYRTHGPIVDLLYDSLVTADEDAYRPWLATSIEWDEGMAAITLRDDLRFHDGENLTAADVAFTYQFLEDTTLGADVVPSPAPRYRGRSSMVEAVEVVDERMLSISVDAGDDVRERALTVPILPEHVWRERVEAATDADPAVRQGRWEAVTDEFAPPIGSGPFVLDDRSERDHLTLTRFEEHFTLTDDALPGPTTETVRIDVEPSSLSAVEQVADGTADVTTSTLETHAIEAATDRETVEVLESPSRTFYHVGFNVRREPFTTPQVRRAVAGLVDAAWLVDAVFDGRATPVASALSDDWLPDSIADERPATTFFGTDGDLDVEAARAVFEDAGFRYDPAHDRLVRR
ncbi:ABC transporter substrate-binding protein [Natronobeatus ordinarius]|uniref:ABC transporter substrate-binding protein n=1 Tax=Natronobeatus ordinarius TaxID=2963433 RepID=UPI0020CE8686|nr:ABC transporter substrate-binding protein [Natronobeatus ordinarius]